MKQKILLTLIFILLFISQSFGSAIIVGQVVDERGIPVDSAEVKIKNSSITSKTDSKGNYSIEFIPGSFEVLVSKKGYISKSLPLNISQKTKFPAEKIVLVKIPTITFVTPKNLRETIKGKWVIIEGKTDRPANLSINGQKIALDGNYHFKVRYAVNFGENKFKLSASPIGYKETSAISLTIVRDKFQSETEYYKVASHSIIIQRDNDDFTIDNDNKYLVTVKGYYAPLFYDLKKKFIELTRQKDLGSPHYVAFSPDNKYIMVAKSIETIDLYNTEDLNFVKTFYVSDAGRKFATSKEINMILTTSNGIWIFDPSKGITGCYAPFRRGAIDSISISPKGKYVADSGVYGDNAYIVIRDAKKIFPSDIGGYDWEEESKKYSNKSFVNTRRITAVSFGATDSMLLGGTSEGDIFLWKVNEDMLLSEEKHVRLMPQSKVNSITITKDYKFILIGTDNNIFIYDYPTLDFLLSFSEGAEKIIISNDNKSFFYSQGNAIKWGALDINWQLINEFNKLKKDDKI